MRVVAIAKDIGLLSKWNVFVPAETMRALYQLNVRRPPAAIHLHLEDPCQWPPAIAARLRSALATAGYRVMEADPRPFWMKFETVTREDWTGQKLDVTTWEDELSFLTWTLDVLNGLTLVLLIILIAIVVTGIMNTMWIAIRERTREIGTLRAIGMQRGGVLRMFLCESVLLGLIGTAGARAGGGHGRGSTRPAHRRCRCRCSSSCMSDHLQLAVHAGCLCGAWRCSRW